METELVRCYRFIEPELLALDHAGLLPKGKPTGGQISKLMERSSSGKLPSDLAELLKAMFPNPPEGKFWKDLNRLWPVRNKAAHGGAEVGHQEVVEVRDKLMKGGLLNQFCQLFADSPG